MTESRDVPFGLGFRVRLEVAFVPCRSEADQIRENCSAFRETGETGSGPRQAAPDVLNPTRGKGSSYAHLQECQSRRSSPGDSRLNLSVPSFSTGDFTLARTGNLVLPHVGSVIACKFAARRTANTVSILRRDLFPTTANRNVEQWQARDRASSSP
jgi:hypothetical protein